MRGCCQLGARIQNVGHHQHPNILAYSTYREYIVASSSCATTNYTENTFIHLKIHTLQLQSRDLETTLSLITPFRSLYLHSIVFIDTSLHSCRNRTIIIIMCVAIFIVILSARLPQSSAPSLQCSVNKSLTVCKHGLVRCWLLLAAASLPIPL